MVPRPWQAYKDAMPKETKEPEEEKIVTLSVRMPASLHADIEALAKTEDRSISAVGVRALRDYLAASKAATAKRTRAAG